MRISGVLLLSFSLVTLLHAGTDTIFVKVHGDTVTIWNQNVFENCSFRAGMSATLSNDTITVLENDTTSLPPAFCFCFYDIFIDVIGLNPGDYLALVYRSDHGGSARLIGSASFHYGGTSGILRTASNQSDCRLVAVEEGKSDLPSETGLQPNYPNPFNPSTSITYTIPRVANVKLEVYNVLGERVAILADGTRQAGSHTVTFDASASSRLLPSGLYFVRFSAGNYIRTGKMVLIR